MARIKGYDYEHQTPAKNRAAELKTQLLKKTGTKDLKDLDYDAQTPQVKATLTRIRNLDFGNGNFSEYIYKPVVPKLQPEIKHVQGWRYFICCQCNGVCWFLDNSLQSIEQYSKCGDGKDLGLDYCGHSRCSGCLIESIEGESWLSPGLSQAQAITYCNWQRGTTLGLPHRRLEGENRSDSEQAEGSNEDVDTDDRMSA
ncbi:hypothetical protein EJ05DRAFT_199614 [Pseudovirgaria hyperparasitica]|uniref:Uncharacterized protein n=1 Tax=Pseudovirgaria hyperparasitica TaxID=470096 RepID=A0A6A6WJ60_9PEZI|nr:uncharacterized protein EJ05DRAFT_199614 [Pseudovirgaria hyperparasitica]KAF2762170.1 hypothetical protein EJ05DRAFT_199614 [Pseudovirgaria hyperparasitica]